MNSVHLLVFMKAQAGKEDLLKEAVQALIAPTHAEAGCLAYTLFEEQAGSLFLYEAWRSQEDLNLHLKMPYLQAFSEQGASLLAEQSEFHIGKNLVPAGKASQNPSKQTFNLCGLKQAKAGEETAVRQALMALVAPSQAEAGCLAYELFEEGQGRFFFYEVWASEADFKAHQASAHVAAFKESAADWTQNNRLHLGRLISEVKA